MKRIIGIVLAFILLLPVSCALGDERDERYEGEGAAGPRELAQAYVQAINSGDIRALIRLFAIESFVDNKKPEEAMVKNGMTVIRAQT